jgi:hypothetical protein
MRQWHDNLSIFLLLAVALAAAGAFIGHRALAQTADGPTRERSEGSNAKTGNIENMTPQQMEAMLQDEENAVYHFAGALNDNASSDGKGTAVQCSNANSTISTTIEVQLFEYNATSVYTGTITVEPLETSTFESRQIAFYLADVFMNAGLVEQGYGRILSSHDDIVCTVQTIDPHNSPPTWSFDLPLYTDPLDAVFLPTVQN